MTCFSSVIGHRRLALWLFAAALMVGIAGSTLVACATDADFYDNNLDRARREAEQPCYAHSGPQPVDLLDWRVEFDSTTDYGQGGPQVQQHPEVSCEVGIGILTGWWQWHELSSPDCGDLALDTADGSSSVGSADWSRLNPIEPVLLSEGDVVVGHFMVKQGDSRLIGATSKPECFLGYLNPPSQRPS